tara:strand:- start:2090 stop:2638 length:549 start_codon:yes stop_codon:yes gene_type:complete
LLTLLSNFSTQELEAVCVNFKLTIRLLEQSVTELLENRRLHGALLPRENKSIDKVINKGIQKLSYEQILLEKEYLIMTINELCLTEAIIVRDNFSNCLEFITAQELQSSSVKKLVNNTLATNKESGADTAAIIEKSNISPIRLTEIKQRLAQALIISDDKKEQVKSKLNELITLTQSAKLRG